MGMPSGIGIVDTMLGFPHADMKEVYRFITRQTKDTQSKEEFKFPAEYMFKDVPERALEGSEDPIGVTLREMDLWGIAQGLVGVGDKSGVGADAMKRYPDRFIPSSSADPNEGMKGIRRLVREYETFGVRAVGVFPAGTFPQVPINDKKMYPIYAKCIELGIPIFCCAGVPGPRLKFEPQRVELIDEVMFDFPDLIFVTRHGCEPWTELAVKLMLKWPGLHYSTSAFAPKYYPNDILDYANSRGADKIIYAGYFPMGLSIERIMTEMPNVGFHDDVWPKFLRGNARRVLGLDCMHRLHPMNGRPSPHHRPPAPQGARMTDTITGSSPSAAGSPSPPSTTPPLTPTTTTTRRPMPTPATSTRPWPSGPCSGPRSTAAPGCWWAGRSTSSSPTPPSTRWRTPAA